LLSVPGIGERTRKTISVQIGQERATEECWGCSSAVLGEVDA